MKITLTIPEAIKLIAEYVNFPQIILGEGDIKIEASTESTKMNFVEAMYRITMMEFKGTLMSSNKIAAIKRLQEYHFCRVAEAKYAIENPTAAIEHYLKTGIILAASAQW
jgi:ribosomal protein L7/L12